MLHRCFFAQKHPLQIVLSRTANSSELRSFSTFQPLANEKALLLRNEGSDVAQLPCEPRHFFALSLFIPLLYRKNHGGAAA